jgi:hypothetical protein
VCFLLILDRPPAGQLGLTVSRKYTACGSYLAEHASGFQGALSGSFLKCVLVINGTLRYCGSFTSVLTTSQTPLASLWRSYHSVTTAFSL